MKLDYCQLSGKLKYAAHDGAHTALRALVREGKGDGCHVYRCGACRQWHIGRSAGIAFAKIQKRKRKPRRGRRLKRLHERKA